MFTGPAIFYRGFLVWVAQAGRDWCARLESVDGQVVRHIRDAAEAWLALDRALNLVDVIHEGAGSPKGVRQ